MIWIARHGETTWNLAGRYQGRMESALSGLGMQQAMALGHVFFERLRDGETVPARVVSSPMLRCTATATLPAQRLGLTLETDARLIEIAHGTWDGRYREEIAANDPERFRAWREDPAHVAFDGGESLRGVLARWQSFARDLAARDEDTLVVTHDAVVRCALLDLQGLPLEDFWKTTVENAAYAVVERDGTGLRLVGECVTAHLAGVRADVAHQAL